MNKQLLIVLTFVGLIGGFLFADQIAAIFHGMTPLEALKMIMDYILHVAIVTIIGMVLFGLPEIIKPWMGLLRQKRRAMRRGAPVQTQPAQRAPRINKDHVLMWLASQMSRQGKQASETSPQQDDIQIKF